MINAKQEVLCVREARTPNDQPARTNWKLPGGLMDLGEEVGEAAAREVYEETGVRAKFQSLVSMRVQHGAAFGRMTSTSSRVWSLLLRPSTLLSQTPTRLRVCVASPRTRRIDGGAAKERGRDTMNSWLMRNVAKEIAKATIPQIGVGRRRLCPLGRMICIISPAGKSRVLQYADAERFDRPAVLKRTMLRQRLRRTKRGGGG